MDTRPSSRPISKSSTQVAIVAVAHVFYLRNTVLAAREANQVCLSTGVSCSEGAQDEYVQVSARQYQGTSMNANLSLEVDHFFHHSIKIVKVLGAEKHVNMQFNMSRPFVVAMTLAIVCFLVAYCVLAACCFCARRKKILRLEDALSGSEDSEANEGAHYKRISKVKDPTTSTARTMHNLPKHYSRQMLLTLLDDQGFAGKYNFVYLPIDVKTRSGVGHAFLNFVTVEDALEFTNRLQGFRNWAGCDGKPCEVNCSGALHSLEAQIDTYRNSPVMHESFPDEFKPVLFAEGARIPFPKPSKFISRGSLQTPRVEKDDPASLPMKTTKTI